MSKASDSASDDDRPRSTGTGDDVTVAMPASSPVGGKRPARSAGDRNETPRHGSADTLRGRLEIRCPTCSTSLDIAADTKLTDLTCDSCGSHFSLVDQSMETRAAPSLTKMGRFELLERLGVGGFGTVWKARDQELDRAVALKIPRQGSLTAEEIEKFFREARAAAQLRHPNIVSVHEVGRDGDSIYIVSEYVRGVTLGDWMSGQQLTCRDSAELCVTIAEALEHAHEHGVVHRDLKPANVMMDGDGRPHLMDFGLARREAGDVTMTLDGQVLGTPAYMSPEQALGESHTADRRSDVYSLGVILFQMLTGELPFRGNPRMLLHQVINDEPPSPRKLNATIPRDLETITLKCLAKSPAKRYARATDVAEDLRRWLTRRPILARPAGLPERAWGWVRRNPAAAGLGLVIAASLLAIAGLSLRSASAIRSENVRTHAALADAEKARADAEKARTDAEASAEKFRRQLYSTSMNLAAQDWNSGAVPRLLTTLGQQRPEPGQSDLRSFAWRHFWRNSAPYATSTILHADATTICTAYSSDGERLACGLAGGSIVVWRPGSGDFVRRIKTDGQAVMSLAFASTGPLLVALKDSGVVDVWDSNTGDMIGSTTSEGSKVTAVAADPSSKVFATGSGKGTIRLWGFDGNPLPLEFERYDQAVAGLAWSKDGKRIAASYSNANVVVWDATTGKRINEAEIVGGPDHVGGLAMSPDGTLVAGSGYQRIHVWNASTGERLRTIFCHPNEVVYSISWSPDGRTIATGGGDGVSTLHDAATGDRIRNLKGQGNTILSVRFSPDGMSLASAGAAGTTVLWDVGAFGERDVLTLSKDIFNALQFTADGTTAVAGTDRGDLVLWDAATGQEIRRIESAHNGRWPIAGLAMFPDGKKFATIGGDDEIRIWDAPTLTSVREITPDATPSGSLAIDASGRRWAYLSDEKSIVVGDAESASAQRTLEGHSDAINQIAFSPDGKKIVSVGRALPAGGEAILWNAETGEKLAGHKEPRARIQCVAFSPTGNVLAIGLEASDGAAEILLCDAATLEIVARLAGDAPVVESLCFSPDGETILAGGSDGAVRFWGVATHSDEGSFPRENGRAKCIAFNRAGTIAAIARDIGTTQLLRASAPSAIAQANNAAVANLPRPVEHWPLDSGSEEALLFYDSLVKERTASMGADNPATLQGSLLLSAAYAKRGVPNWNKEYKTTLARLRDVLGPSHRDVLRAEFDLGQIYEGLGRPVIAASVFQRCLQSQRAQLGRAHRETIETIEALAKAYGEIGRRDDQLQLQEELLAAKKELLGGSHAEYVVAENRLIDELVAAGKLAPAVPLWRHRLEILRQQIGPQHANVVSAELEFSGILKRVGESKEAIDLLRGVVVRRPDNWNAQARLCELYAEAGNADAAAELVRAAKIETDNAALSADDLYQIGSMYYWAGDSERAIELLLRSVANDDQTSDEAWLRLAGAYDKAGRNDDALTARRHAFDLAFKRSGSAGKATQEARKIMFGALLAAGRPDEAVDSLPKPVGDVFVGRYAYYDAIQIAYDQKRVDVAATLANVLVKWAHDALAKTPDREAAVHITSAEYLAARQRWDVAEILARKGVEVAQATFGKNHPQMHRANAALLAVEQRRGAAAAPDGSTPPTTPVKPPIEELFESIDEPRTVVFRAAGVGGNNNLFINSFVDFQRKDCFTAKILPEALEGMSEIGVKNPWFELPGKLVEVTGVVTLDADNKVLIVVSKIGGQFRVVPDAAAEK